MRADKFEVEKFPDLTGFKPGSGTSKRLRVCIMTEEIFGPVRNGGIGSTYYHLARKLNEAGHDVTVLYMKSDKSENGPIEKWVKFYKELGIRFVPLPIVPGHGASHWQERHYSGYMWLRSRSLRFDVVHVSEWRGAAFYALLAKKQGLAFQETLFLVKASSPHIWNRHYMMEYLPQMSLLPVMYPEQMSIELADMVIGGSAHLLSFMQHVGYALPADRTYVQPNVLQFDTLSIEDKRGNIEIGDRVQSRELAFFGRLEARKGLAIFCDALDFLVERGQAPERVAFLGKQGVNMPTSPDMRNVDLIRQRAESWPFEIEIHEDLDQEKVLQFLVEKPWIAVMPSLIENSTMAVYEALVYKVPFIATAVGGTPELIVKDDHPFVLSEANPRDLANAMERVMLEGGLVAGCSFDNARNLEVWHDFHEHLAERKASNTLRDLSAVPKIEQTPKLSLCLFSDGDLPSLRRFVEHAIANADPSLAEIVVAATKSNDEFQAYFKSGFAVPLRLVHATEMSLGEAFNAAAKAATGACLLFMRSDIHTPLEGYTSKLSKAFAHSGADALSCIWRIQGKVTEKAVTLLPTGADLATGLIDKRSLSGRVIATTAQAFEAAGGFDPIFGMSGIEQDLYSRIAMNGVAYVVPEELYMEAPSQTRLSLNEAGSQFMASSGHFDNAPYFLKRFQLAVGMLVGDQFAAAQAKLTQIAEAEPAPHTFDIANPLPETGYENPPRLCIQMSERSTRLHFILMNQTNPGKLQIRLNGDPIARVELNRLDDTERLHAWFDLSSVEAVWGAPLIRIMAETGTAKGAPRRLLEIIPESEGIARVHSPENYIELTAPDGGSVAASETPHSSQNLIAG